MITHEQARDVEGAEAYSGDGEEIGTVSRIFVDDRTGQLDLVAVRTGLLGTHECLVPVDQAAFNSLRLTVPFSKDQVTGAPRADDDGPVDAATKARVYAHYEIADPFAAGGS